MRLVARIVANLYLLSIVANLYLLSSDMSCFAFECAGGPCAVFISCVPSQLWIHSSHTL